MKRRILNGIPLEFTSLESLSIEQSIPKFTSAVAKVSVVTVLRQSAEKAYEAYLSCNLGCVRKSRFTKKDLVRSANTFALEIGLKKIPYLEVKTARKLGLNGTQMVHQVYKQNKNKKLLQLIGCHYV